jgi:hypothetical protein
MIKLWQQAKMSKLEVAMVRPDVAKWGQTEADLRRLSVEAAHSRTRERFLALYMIGSKQTNATQWALTVGRTKETVLGWVHTYNAEGPEALTYRRTGGRRPLFAPNR